MYEKLKQLLTDALVEAKAIQAQAKPIDTIKHQPSHNLVKIAAAAESGLQFLEEIADHEKRDAELKQARIAEAKKLVASQSAAAPAAVGAAALAAKSAPSDK